MLRWALWVDDLSNSNRFQLQPRYPWYRRSGFDGFATTKELPQPLRFSFSWVAPPPLGN